VAYSLSGVVFSYYADVPSGPSIVVLAIAGFAIASILGVVVQRWRTAAVPAPPVAGDDVHVVGHERLGEPETTRRDR
jgi:zinc transport system permease protein